ncbi:MAG: flagellar basal body rod protein FlgC [Hyphomicrobiaceae bacterium]|nr:flagellar basal body rod protein FlgC [Hyphomicrobiaceae bacterium]
MIDDLKAAILSAGSGLHAQSTRMRIVSENIANASATASAAGGDPYQRKTITFSEELDRLSGASLVRISNISHDKAPFPTELDPSNPAADETGYVKMPNVNPLVELTDMRESHRSYEANLQVVRQAREMIADLIDLLKGK